jgi:hypothetical protein
VDDFGFKPEGPARDADLIEDPAMLHAKLLSLERRAENAETNTQDNLAPLWRKSNAFDHASPVRETPERYPKTSSPVWNPQSDKPCRQIKALRRMANKPYRRIDPVQTLDR